MHVLHEIGDFESAMLKDIFLAVLIIVLLVVFVVGLIEGYDFFKSTPQNTPDGEEHLE